MIYTADEFAKKYLSKKQIEEADKIVNKILENKQSEGEEEMGNYNIKLSKGNQINNICDLGNIFIVGTTGSGKSVFINNMLFQLLKQNTEQELELMLFDEKLLELTPYNGIPHLLMPVVTNYDNFELALNKLNDIFKKRTELSKNESQKLPFILVVFDEASSFLYGFDEEQYETLKELLKDGNQYGIYFVISTQVPIIINKELMNYFKTKIAFRVLSEEDSLYIINESGAESLEGNGDMLLLTDKLYHLNAERINDDEIFDLIEKYKL